MSDCTHEAELSTLACPDALIMGDEGKITESRGMDRNAGMKLFANAQEA